MPVDNLELPASIAIPVCSVLVLNEQAQCLIVKPAGSDYWQLPMIQLQANETAIDAVVRLGETELALDIQGVEPIGISSAHASNKHTLTGGQNAHFHNVIFSSTHWQALENKQPAGQAQFFSMAELPPLSQQTQHVMAVFQAWLPQRVLQFE